MLKFILLLLIPFNAQMEIWNTLEIRESRTKNSPTYIQFYFKDRNSQVFKLKKSSNSIFLRCKQGEKFLYGAWRENKSWGCGYQCHEKSKPLTCNGKKQRINLKR